jgi:hypothetical protein
VRRLKCRCATAAVAALLPTLVLRLRGAEEGEGQHLKGEVEEESEREALSVEGDS